MWRLTAGQREVCADGTSWGEAKAQCVLSFVKVCQQKLFWKRKRYLATAG